MRYTKQIVYLLVVSCGLARSFTLSNVQPNGYHLRTTLSPLRIAPKQSARNFRTSLWRGLQSSSSAGSDSEGSDKNQGRRQRWNHRLVKFANRVSSRVSAPYTNFMTRFRRLSKRGKMLVTIQLFVLSLLFGSMSRSIYSRVAGSASGSASAAGRKPIEISYSSFMDLVEQHQTGPGIAAPAEPLPSIDNIRIGTDRIAFRLYREETAESDSASSSKTTKFINAYTKKVPASPELIQWMRKNKLPFMAMSQKRVNAVTYTIRSAVVTFYALFLWRMYRTMNGAAGNNAKDTPGKLLKGDLPSASFEDIQGIDSAKTEVMELVDTLRNPDKYSILGARAPTGLLLEGPPGTGKTMLARATAASAGVPLLYCSGSDFVEMFVGRGAARVRKMFERATRLAPCIIFIDELDTLGKARDSGANMMMPGSRGNDEAEQTLNQLLACMDGLDSSRRICVLAATNRKDVLDSALIRPGRFDRIVKLTLPNAQGRENILRVHAKKLPGFEEGRGLDDSRLNALGKGNRVDLSAVAAVTDGLSGADLEFVVNEAAIRAVRRVSAAIRSGANTRTLTPSVTPADFEASIANFMQTRRSSSNNMWKNVWGT